MWMISPPRRYVTIQDSESNILGMGDFASMGATSPKDLAEGVSPIVNTRLVGHPPSSGDGEEANPIDCTGLVGDPSSGAL